MHIGLRAGRGEEAVQETASGPLVVAGPSRMGRHHRLADLCFAVSLAMLSASRYEATYADVETARRRRRQVARGNVLCCLLT